MGRVEFLRGVGLVLLSCVLLSHVVVVEVGLFVLCASPVLLHHLPTLGIHVRLRAPYLLHALVPLLLAWFLFYVGCHLHALLVQLRFE